MQVNRRLLCQGLALGASAAALPGWANAEKFPSRAIRVIVPYNAGGQTDTIARHAASGAAVVLGQPVVVENRPGVAGNLGAELVANSAPDGHTVLITLAGSPAVGEALYKKVIKYNPSKDLRCISDLASGNAVWVVHTSIPAKSLRELVDYTKANPNKVSIGSWGPGTSNHASQHMLNTVYGGQFLHVPYKGEGQIITDLVGGQINMSMISPLNVSAHLKSGKLRPIAVSGPTRSPVFPDVPTLTEQGFKQPAWSMSGPTSVFVPRAVPEDVVQALAAAFAKATREAKFQTFAKEAGLQAVGNMPEQAQPLWEKYFDAIKQTTLATGVVIDG